MTPPADDEPLDLDRVDQEIRINNLRNQIEDITGEELVMGCGGEKLTPDLEEGFLENILAMEEHGFARPFEVLEKEGVPLPSPDELDDASINDHLWKLLHACAKHRLFFYHTDHLSDRELYTYLWSDGLREEMMGFGLPYGNTHLDVIGSGSDEHTTLGLRFYDDDAYVPGGQRTSPSSSFRHARNRPMTAIGFCRKQPTIESHAFTDCHAAIAGANATPTYHPKRSRSRYMAQNFRELLCPVLLRNGRLRHHPSYGLGLETRADRTGRV